MPLIRTPLVAAFALLALLPHVHCHAKIVSILIAVGAYDTPPHLAEHIAPLTPLKGPVNDANRLRETLTKYCGVDPESILLLTTDTDEPNRRPTYANIAAAFTQAKAQLTDEDVLLVYFAGHGGLMPPPANSCLAVQDTDHSSFEQLVRTSIKSTDLAMLLGATGRLQIVITDCCRAPLENEAPAIGGLEDEALAQNTPVELRGGGKTGDADDEARHWAFTMREATEKAGPVSRAVLYACSPGQAARTGTNGLGVFTGFLVSGLEGEAARDGCVKVGDLFDYVSQKMSASGRQTPDRVVGGQASDVILAQHDVPERQPVTLIAPGGDRRFDTIGQALAQARSGNTVRVAAGSYYEDVSLKSGVNLVGAGPTSTIIKGSPSPSSSYLPVLVLEGSGNCAGIGLSAGGRQTGIEIKGSRSLRDINVEGGKYGVSCSKWFYAVVLAPLGEGKPDEPWEIEFRGVSVDSAENTGIVITNPHAKVRITDAKVTGCVDGVRSECAEFVLSRSSIMGCRGRYAGLALSDACRATLTDVRCEGNATDGVFVAGTAQIEATNLELLDNAGAGLLAQTNGTLSLKNVTARGNKRSGVSMSRASKVTLDGGTISGNANDGVTSFGIAVTTVQMKGVTLSSNGDSGIHVQGATHLDVSQCRFTDDQVRVWGPSVAQIQGSEFSGGDTTIAMYSAGQVTLTNSRFVGARTRGVYAGDNSSLIATGNRFRDMPVGIQIGPKVARAEYSGNMAESGVPQLIQDNRPKPQ